MIFGVHVQKYTMISPIWLAISFLLSRFANSLGSVGFQKPLNLINLYTEKLYRTVSIETHAAQP